MRSSGKKTKYKLLVDSEEGEHFIGLVCAEADYKTSIILNNKLDIYLKSNKPLITGEGTREISFPKFSSGSKYSDIIYDLICNKSGSEYLFPKFSNLDFIFRISGAHNADIINSIISKIRNTKEITGVFILNEEILPDNNMHQITH